MREEIEKIINEKFNDNNLVIDKHNEGNKNIIELVNKQNEKINNEKYKRSLLDQIKQMKELDINIEYDETMSIKELEEIINNTHFK